MALALSPALLFAQKISYDYEKTANFAGFKTYALKDGTKVGQPLIDDRIVAAIEQELAAKGFTKADANPDVFVVYHTPSTSRRTSRRSAPATAAAMAPTGGAGAAAGPAAPRRRRCATS